MRESWSWRRLFAWWLRPTPAEAEECRSESPAIHARRQRCLERMFARHTAWHAEPEHCDGCERELLLGERALLMSRGDGLFLACQLCTERLYAEGYRAAGWDAETDATEGRRLCSPVETGGRR